MHHLSATGQHRSFAFMHIEKTGGTSVEAILKQHFAEDELFPVYGAKEWDKVTPDQIKDPFKLFVGHYSFDQVELFARQRPFLCTIVREPVSHCVSTYNHMRLRPDSHKFEEFERENMDFRRYVHDVLPGDFNLGAYSQSIRVVGRAVFRALRQKTSGPAELQRAVIEVACGNLDKFHLVGTTDSLDQTIRRICAHLGVDRPATMPRKNTSVARNPHDKPVLRVADLDAELLAEVRDLYSPDSSVYEYARQSGVSPQLRSPC